MSEIVYRRCCGTDVHKSTIVVCVLPAVATKGLAMRKTYRTLRHDPTRMRGWLELLKVTEIHWGLLAAGVGCAGATGIPVIAGESGPSESAAGSQERWTRDAKRIAEFLQDGRLDPSFVPPPEVRELRQLMRHRLSLLQQRSASCIRGRDGVGHSGYGASWEVLGVVYAKPEVRSGRHRRGST